MVFDGVIKFNQLLRECYRTIYASLTFLVRRARLVLAVGKARNNAFNGNFDVRFSVTSCFLSLGFLVVKRVTGFFIFFHIEILDQSLIFGGGILQMC